MLTWLTSHWWVILQLIGLLVVLLIIYINFFVQKTPRWLADLVSYLNFREEKEIDKHFIYSKYCHRHEIKWLQGYTGKREGKELFFGILEENGGLLFCAMLKAEVSPMIISNQLNGEKLWPYQDQLLIKKRNYELQAKENFLLANVTNSANFQLMLGEIFQGERNTLEFTELNQIIFITDHAFSDSKEGMEFFSTFIHLKDNL